MKSIAASGLGLLFPLCVGLSGCAVLDQFDIKGGLDAYAKAKSDQTPVSAAPTRSTNSSSSSTTKRSSSSTTRDCNGPACP